MTDSDPTTMLGLAILICIALVPVYVMAGWITWMIIT